MLAEREVPTGKSGVVMFLHQHIAETALAALWGE